MEINISFLYSCLKDRHIYESQSSIHNREITGGSKIPCPKSNVNNNVNYICTCMTAMTKLIWFCIFHDKQKRHVWEAAYNSTHYTHTRRRSCYLNYNFYTLRPRQNGRLFPDDVFKCIFLNENLWISIKISLKFVPKGPINNVPALVQIMAWYRPGDRPLSEPMMVILPTHVCVTRPQWVHTYCWRV